MIIRENIKEKFLAVEHGRAIAIGDYKKATKLHKKLQSLYDLTKKENMNDVFSELLDLTDENVKLWAATFTLKILPDSAEKTLTELTKSPTIIGLSAQTTLHMWKAGKLNLL